MTLISPHGPHSLQTNVSMSSSSCSCIKPGPFHLQLLLLKESILKNSQSARSAQQKAPGAMGGGLILDKTKLGSPGYSETLLKILQALNLHSCKGS